MEKKLNTFSSFEDLAKNLGVERPQEEESEQEKHVPELELKGRVLKIWLKRLKSDRLTTEVVGFSEEEDLSALTRELKQLCGGGGSSKHGVIIIQGNHRERVREFLAKKGANAKLAGG